MNLDILKGNVEAKKYKSVEAFHADAKWILHNCTVYPEKRKYVSQAKGLLKICRQELLEIETCFECYFKANTTENWFTDVCSTPHVLLWAKLRGFPYWPAKAMNVNSQGLVNVRFFGAHDRSWVAIKDCFLYSEEDPNGNNRKKRNDIAECIKEVDTHIDKLSETFNGFKHAPLRTAFDPNNEIEQLKLILPNFDKFHRTTDTNKLVEALISGRKPKLTLKIIRTADNNLSLKSIESIDDDTESSIEKFPTQKDEGVIKLPVQKDELGIQKFKILNSSKKNCQIMPINNESKESDSGKLEFTMKRSAESWTMVQSQKKSKTDEMKSELENDQEKQKGILMESLNLRGRNASIGSRNVGDPKIESPSPVERNEDCEESSSSASKIVSHKKRRITAQFDNTNNDNSSMDEPAGKRRSLRPRNKSTVEPNYQPPQKPAQKQTNTANTRSNSDNSSGKRPPPPLAMSEPPPLVPFDIQIKSEPASDDELSPNLAPPPPPQTSSRNPSKRLLNSSLPNQHHISANSRPTAGVQVKDINKLTNPPTRGKKIYLTPVERPKPGSGANVIPLPANLITRHSGTNATKQTAGNSSNNSNNNSSSNKSTTMNGPQSNSGNMVYIPANGPVNEHSNGKSNTSSPDQAEPPMHALAGFITPSLAAAVTDTIVRGPPKLHMSKSSGSGSKSALRSESTSVYASEAGVASKALADNAYRLADNFRNIIEDTLKDLSSRGSLEAQVRLFEIEIEQMKLKHTKEISELKHNSGES